MPDFLDTMRSLFGYDPSQGQTLQPGMTARLPAVVQPQSTAQPQAGVAQSPMDAARILATLPMRSRGIGTSTDGGSIGLGSQLAGGMSMVKPGTNFAIGLAQGLGGSLKAGEEAQARAQANDIAARKAQFDMYKSLFDMQNATNDRQRQAANDAYTQARQSQQDAQTAQVQQFNQQRQTAQDAETKRYHDILNAYYQKQGKEGTPTDWTLPQNRVIAQNLETKKRAELGLDPVSMHKDQEVLNDQFADPALKQSIQARTANAEAQFQAWLQNQDWAKQKGAPAAKGTPDQGTGAPAQGEDEGAPATDTAPQPAAQGQAPQAAAAGQPAPSGPTAGIRNPRRWIPYTTTDGKTRLFDPTTGEKLDINSEATGTNIPSQTPAQTPSEAQQ